MSAKLHSVWSILAHDGVGDAIGDARPIFVVSRDGRFLHFANAGGARFLGLAPAAALDARVALEPRLAERLARFTAASAPGATARELVRYFGGLRSSLLSVGFRRLADDAVLVSVDNAPLTAADADPAASLAAIAAEGGLVALFDGAGDVVAALGDHAALDDVQDDIATALDTEDGEAVFTRRVAGAGRAHDLALVRLGDGDHPRRLLHVGTAVALAETPATAPSAEVTPASAPVEAPSDFVTMAVAEPAVAPDVAAPVPADLPAPIAPATPAPLVRDLLADDGEPAASLETPVHAAALAAMAPAETIYALPPVSPLELEADEIRVETVDPTGGDVTSAATEGPAATDGSTVPVPRTDDDVSTETLTAVDTEAQELDATAETTTAHLEPEAPPAALVAATGPIADPGMDVATSEVAVADAVREPEISAEPVEAIASPAEEPTTGFRYRPAPRSVKFVWQMDAERRFTLLSPELADVVGPAAADVIGHGWREVAERFQMDGDGRVATALERRDTWSGRTVLWPVEGEALRLPVDLAALPAFDRGRVFTGYRGFGTIRGEEAVPDPTGTGLRLAAPATPAAEPTEPAAADAPAETGAADVAIAPVATLPLASTEAPLDARLDDAAPPAYPDDSEVALVEAHHPRPVEPTIDGGEAAFAGEIEPTATADDDLGYDDELALAMATLPACGEGRPTTATPTEAIEPDAVSTAPEVMSPPIEAAIPPVAETLDALEPRLAPAPDHGAETVASPAALAAMEPIETIYALPPSSPLDLEADDLRLVPDETAVEPAPALAAPAPLLTPSSTSAEPEDAPIAAEPPAALIEPDLGPAALADATAAPSPAEPPHATRADRLAEAPAALRAAVAEIAERAAELEPRIVLPHRDAQTEMPAEAEPAIEPSAPTALAMPAEPTSDAPTAPEPSTMSVAAAAADLEPTPSFEAAGVIAPAPVSEGTPSIAPTPASALTSRPIAPPAPLADTASNIVALAASTHPTAEAVRLSPPERVAFRQIAEALGARIEGEASPTAEDRTTADTTLAPAAAPTTMVVDTRLLDRLPGAVAVVKDDDLVYGNDAFLRLLGYPDLATLAAEGGLDALFAGEHVAKRWRAAPDGTRPVPVLARDGRVIPVDATVATVPWTGGSALMLTLAEVQATPNTDPAETIVPATETALAPAVAAPVAAPVQAAPIAPLAAASLSDGLADAALRDRLGELEAIIDTATDGVLMLDGEGTILSANHAAEALFGTDRHAMVGRPLADRLAPESRRSAMDYLDGLARNGVASVLNDGREVIGVVEQGGLIPLFMTIGRISGTPARKYCAVLRDITQWKKSEEDLTAARRRAEEASVHKSDFLAKISHEIRTPLNAIIGFSEVMMDERFGPVGNERYKDYLRDIHSSGSHIMSLINDLLDLSKVEAGKMDLRFEAVTLADIVSECVAMMQPQANRERIIIRSSLPGGVPPVVADPRSVRQVVLNLLSNAIKFTPSGGQVIVSTTLEDSGEVVLRVRDTGYGMTDKELQTAMEPFRQLHTTRSRGGGTGLGLPLTKALVEANRAVFRIDSTVGQGTLVTVTFPVTRVLAS